MVPGAGVEPARPYGHMALNHACLPIPAPGQNAGCKYSNSDHSQNPILLFDLLFNPERTSRANA